MTLSKELYTLLKENHVFELFYTHLSLIQPKGKYSLSRNVLSKFWDLYSKIIQKEKDIALGIAEAPQLYSSVIVDVDLKFKLEQHPEEKTLYSQDFVTELIHIYQDVLREVVIDIKESDLVCVLLEKPMYIVSDDQTLYKNGFHLHFPYLFLNKIEQEIVIIPKVRKYMSENKYDIKNKFETFSDNIVNIKSIEDLIDTAAIKNSWLLYGSKKTEEQEPYLVTKIYNQELEELKMFDAFKDYQVYDENEELIELNEGNIEFYLPRILSIVPYGRKVYEIKNTGPILTKYIQKPKYVDHEDNRPIEVISKELEEASKLISFLNEERANDRNDWMMVGWALYNISRGGDDGLDVWLEFSRKSPKFNEPKCIYEWTHMIDRKKITLGTLKYFAKLDNPDEYQKFLIEEGRKNMKKELKSSHYDLAVLLHEQVGHQYVFTDAGWYTFNNHKWIFIERDGYELRNKISKDLVEFFDGMLRETYIKLSQTPNDEDLKKNQKDIACIIKCLKTTNFKNNVMKECQEVFYDRDFEKKLNTNRYLIGFQNGVFDLENNYFRKGLPTDYISVQMSISYKEFDSNDRRVIDVYNFLEKVFPDSSLRRYFMDVMSETFVGYNHRKNVYFWTGEGDNGKSITQMFFEKMFGKLSIKGPTTMITSKRPGSGSANAELARTGNGVRTIFLEEPDPDEEIYIGVFKHLSGNDTIYARDLFQKGKDAPEIVPMFKLFVICNELPSIRKGGDKATWNRIRVIPFESTFSKTAPSTIEEQIRDKVFPVDSNFAQKIPELVEPFAWVLLNHRTQPKINEPEKVLTATDRYRMNNDYKHQFASQSIMNDENGVISPTDLCCKYKDWLDENYPGMKPPPRMEVIKYFQKKWGDTDESGCWKGKRFKMTTEDSGSSKNALNQIL
jgi:P4 family phage/plasmid primase-like protien